MEGSAGLGAAERDVLVAAKGAGGASAIESALASAHTVVGGVMTQMRSVAVATRRRRQQRAMWSMRRRVI